MVPPVDTAGPKGEAVARKVEPTGEGEEKGEDGARKGEDGVAAGLPSGSDPACKVKSLGGEERQQDTTMGFTQCAAMYNNVQHGATEGNTVRFISAQHIPRKANWHRNYCRCCSRHQTSSGSTMHPQERCSRLCWRRQRRHPPPRLQSF